jgi:hypothetical protein
VLFLEPQKPQNTLNGIYTSNPGYDDTRPAHVYLPGRGYK